MFVENAWLQRKLLEVVIRANGVSRYMTLKKQTVGVRGQRQDLTFVLWSSDLQYAAN